jgi:hypothetical protein
VPADDESLVRWRARHSRQLVTWTDELAAVAVEAEYVTGLDRESGLAIRPDAVPAAVWLAAPA